MFDKFDPAIWIPAQRLLEMSKWVGQGAEAASLTITSVGDIETHQSPMSVPFRGYSRPISGFGPHMLTGAPSKPTSKRVVRQPRSWTTFSSNIGSLSDIDIQPWTRC